MNINKKYEHLQVLQMLSKNKSQRNIAKELSIAIGKVNYIAKSLADKGFIKVGNFINKKDKTKYKYILTNDGIKKKVAITRLFIERKKLEYERLQKELEYDIQRIGNIIND